MRTCGIRGLPFSSGAAASQSLLSANSSACAAAPRLAIIAASGFAPPIWTRTTITTSAATMAANAKTALEKIRRIQNQEPALFGAIPQSSTKFFSEQRADWSSAAWISSRRLRRNLSMALDVLKKDCVRRFAAPKFRLDASFGPNIVPQDSAQILDGHVQCVQTGLLHEDKRIRTNGHEC